MNLIDRDKLIEELGDCAYCDFCRRKKAEFCECYACVDDALDKWVNAQPIVNEWIPVERELPKENVDVVLMVKSNIPNKPYKAHIGTRTIGDKFSITIDHQDKFFGEPNYYDVVAWMPIPEYKGDDND